MQIVLSETFAIGYKSEFFYAISFTCLFLSVYVIISKNPIFSVLFLIGLFFGISVYLIMTGLYFIGLSYLLVYVGAVSILFLFILMLINVRVSELITDNKNSIPLAVLTILAFNYYVSGILPYNIFVQNVIGEYIIQLIYNLFNYATFLLSLTHNGDTINYMLHFIYVSNVTSVSSKSWDGMLIVTSHIATIGNILYTNLFILFVIVSLILLLAMVGAIVITIK